MQIYVFSCIIIYESKAPIVTQIEYINQISINHDINDPLIHTIEVDNKNYNLVKVELRKTNFTINNKH